MKYKPLRLVNVSSPTCFTLALLGVNFSEGNSKDNFNNNARSKYSKRQ